MKEVSSCSAMLLNDLLEESLQGILLLYGPAASGKTTLCLQSCTGRTIYISTGKNFSAERLQSMQMPPEILEKLVVFEPRNLEELESMVQTAVGMSGVANLIIIDSIATYLRLADRKLGNLALHRMLQRLQQARCPVIVTSEVYDRAQPQSEVRFVGGDMARLASRTIIELGQSKMVVRKHPLHAGRQWQYTITAAGIQKI